MGSLTGSVVVVGMWPRHQALVNAQLVSEEGSSINDLGEYFEIEPPVIQAIVK